MHLKSIAIGIIACVVITRVAFAQAPTEDVETVKPQSAPTGNASELPWYVPPQGAAFVPPAPPPPPRTEPTDEEKMRGGTLQLNVEPTFFLGSNVTGSSPSAAVLLRMVWPSFGFDIGYLSAPFPTNLTAGEPGTQFSAFVLGISTLHYSAEIFHGGENHLYLMLPELDLRLLVTPGPVSPGTPGGSTGAATAVAFGGSVLGLRYARCLGGRVSFLTELRGPAAFVYAPSVPNTSAAPYASVGFAVSVGIGF